MTIPASAGLDCEITRIIIPNSLTNRNHQNVRKSKKLVTLKKVRNVANHQDYSINFRYLYTVCRDKLHIRANSVRFMEPLAKAG